MTSWITRWKRQSLLMQLLVTASVALLLTGAGMLGLYAHVGIRDARADLQTQLDQHLATLPTAIAEPLIIGDIAAARQAIRQFAAHARAADVGLLLPEGQVLSATQADVPALAPETFSRLTGLTDVHGRVALAYGARPYGELSIRLHAQPAIDRLWDRLLHQAAWLLAALALDGLAIALVLRRGLAPLRTLEDAAHQLAGGRLDTRLAAGGGREIQHVIDAYNQMAEAIESSAHALQTSEERLQLAITAVNDGIWDWDLRTNDLYLSPQWKQMLGYEDHELPNLISSFWNNLHPDDQEHVRDTRARYLSGQIPTYAPEFRMRHKNGSWRWILARGETFRDAHGVPVRMAGSHTDITTQRTSLDALEESETRLKTLVNAMPDIILFKDGEGRWVETNDFTRHYMGLDSCAFRGHTDAELATQRPHYRDAHLACVVTDEAAWQFGQVYRCVEIFPDVHGHSRTFDVLKAPLFNADGTRKALVVIGRDITSLREVQAEAERLMYFDPLTGLPNRALFMEHLGQLLALGARQQHKQALVILDIDRFKNINDARSHALGDVLLKAIGERLRSATRDGDTLARLTADEFAFLLPDLNHHAERASRHVLAVSAHLHKLLEAPFELDGELITVSASAGITLFPEVDGETAEDILRRADTALHRAKESGGKQSAFFETSMGEAAQQRFAVESELRRAIPDGQLRLYLQSQVDAQGQVMGAEVLVRWAHPQRGMVLPGAFVSMAEESDLIVDLGAWVLQEACSLIARETAQGRPLHLAVNLSPRHFRKPEFVTWLRQLFTHTGADPSYLTLEVTEGLMIDNINEVVAKMYELSGLGVHFSVDDFGTGYSSLAYLKRLPIKELKIDKSFVQDAPFDPDDAALVETILAVAQHLHLKVVAEGVETQAQADFLNARAQVIHQGYLFGRPEPAEDWLLMWRPRADADRARPDARH